MIYKIIAFMIMLVFYGCYFGKMLGQRKKGIRTDQIGKGKTGFVKFIEITMKITSYLTPVAEVVSIIYGASLFPDWVRIIGICMGCMGTAVFIISVITMRDSWRAGVPKTDKIELVTDGIYQISRNPAFLGFDLVYIGIALMFFNVGLFIISVLTIFMFHLQIINVEEDFLALVFGEEYLKYKKRVCRYIGRKRIV